MKYQWLVAKVSVRYWGGIVASRSVEFPWLFIWVNYQPFLDVYVKIAQNKNLKNKNLDKAIDYNGLCMITVGKVFAIPIVPTSYI